MLLPEAVLNHFDAAGWARLVCTSRQIKEQVLAAIQNKQHTLSVELSSRTRHKALQHLAFVGTHCPHVTSLKVYDNASYRGLQSLQPLLPCMTAQLQALTLHGVHLARRDCQASQLVQQLLQHCPNLKVLDLQDCFLPHLSVLYGLLAWQQAPTQAAGSMHQLKLEVLQLDGVLELSPGSSSRSSSSSSSCQPGGEDTSAVAPNTLPVAAGVQYAAGTGCSGSLQELHLAAGSTSQAMLRALHCSEVSEAAVRGLLNAASCQATVCNNASLQALRVLDLSKQARLGDGLMQQLVQQQASWALQELDISLTAVTPTGLLALTLRCPQLRVLRYACREGVPSLQQQHLLALAAACPQLSQLDLSLHQLLNNACMAVLATCPQLKQLTLSRSHKVTVGGLAQLLQAGSLQLLTLIRCKGVGQGRLRQLRRQFPDVTISVDRTEDGTERT